MAVPKINWNDADCCETSTLTSADNVKASPGVVYWIQANCTTTAASFILNDATSGTGSAVMTVQILANDSKFLLFQPAIYCATGIRLGTVGSNLSITVGYA